jgi:hypothetical protein
MTMDISLTFRKEPRPLAELIEALQQAAPGATFWMEAMQPTPPRYLTAGGIDDKPDPGGRLIRIVIEVPQPEPKG